MIVNYRAIFTLFSTANQWGYWWSPDLLHWNFISKIPAALEWRIWWTLRPGSRRDRRYDDRFRINIHQSVHYRMSTNPKANEWKPLVDSFDIGGWDRLFTDDDGRLYMYNGSSNRYPIYGVELNRKHCNPKAQEKKCISWNRTGTDGNDLANIPTTLSSTRSLKGLVSKHNGKYYLQYGAPGTEFSGYADGVLVGETPGVPLPPQSGPTQFQAGRIFQGRRPRLFLSGQ